jgi:hypothetical protein
MGGEEQFEVGDRVVFGRERGEKTVGEVVGRTGAGKLKIRQTEARGSERNYREGAVWTVSPELVRRLGGAPPPPRARTREFAVGDRVLFSDGSSDIVATVVRVNPKTLTVEADDGASYRVPPALIKLGVREGEAGPSEQGSGEPQLQTTDHPFERGGLAFTAAAGEVLAERSWVEFQALLRPALESFFARTGRDVSAWFGPMRGLDRYNQPAALVAVWFIFAFRECTEEDVTPLYEGIRASGIHFTAEGLQPLGGPAFPTLFLHGGKLHQVWLEDDPEPVAMSLELDEEGDLAMIGVEWGQLDPAEFLPGVGHTLLRGADGVIEGT